jgi:hypothetical protein
MVKGGGMHRQGLLIKEKIDEVTRMCAREQPIYEHISGFSIALYVLGHFQCADVMSFDDVDVDEAARVLKQAYTRMDPALMPADYDICTAQDHYLLVFGDPSFPEHFAVFVDARSPKPFFSKLKFFGCGFDSLEELKGEFLGKDGVGPDDYALFVKKGSNSA